MKNSFRGIALFILLAIGLSSCMCYGPGFRGRYHGGYGGGHHGGGYHGGGGHHGGGYRR